MSENSIIWTRVSTKYQEDNGGSLEYQKSICDEYASTHNYTVIEYCGGTHESAKGAGDKIRAMMKIVKRDKSIKKILISEFDRFSRCTWVATKMMSDLQERGVIIVAVKTGQDTSTKEGRLMARIAVSLAEFDNEMRTDKFITGRKSCMESGVWCSKAPMGYDKTGKSINTTYTINETGENLRRAFKWKMEGMANEEILTRLSVLGTHISKQTLHKILVNPFYAGKIKNHILGNGIYDGKHPALISYSDFLRVQEILSGRTGRYVHQKTAPQFPLRHHVLCAKDKTPLTAYSNKKKHLDYYKCNKKGCSQNTSAKILHESYKQLLSGYDTPDAVTDIFRKVIKEELKGMNGESEKELTALRKNLTETERNIKEIQLRFATGKIDEDTFNVAMSEFTKKKATLQTQIEENDLNLSNLEKRVDGVVAICSQLGTLWAASDFETCQKIQNLVFPEGIMWDKEKGTYLTIRENSVFALFRRISNTYGKEKGTTSEDVVPLCG